MRPRDEYDDPPGPLRDRARRPGVQAGDVVEAAQDRPARPGGKKRRACWLVTRVAATGTGSSHGCAGGSRNVPGQGGAPEHHRDRLAPEQPHGRAVTDSRERHRRARPGRRRARSAAGRMTARCLPFGAAGCHHAGRPDDGDHENQDSHAGLTQRAAGRFQGRVRTLRNDIVAVSVSGAAIPGRAGARIAQGSPACSW